MSISIPTVIVSVFLSAMVTLFFAVPARAWMVEHIPGLPHADGEAPAP